MNSISMPLTCEVNGQTWRLFAVSHTDGDGRRFQFHIYATSREHAACVVQDIKETAVLDPDDIVGIEPA